MQVIIDEKFYSYLHTLKNFGTHTINQSNLLDNPINDLISQISASKEETFIICPTKNEKEDHFLIKKNIDKIELQHHYINELKQLKIKLFTFLI